jgi:ssDNA-binding replication factor A large subunit
MSEADVAGTVAGTIYTAKETTTKDGRAVKYASFTLKDNTGATMRIVLWNEATTIADKIKEGDTIEVNSGRVRPDRNGKPELHVNTPASVRVLQRSTPEGPPTGLGGSKNV